MRFWASRPLPLGARLRLEAPETLATVSIALGLSRFTDLTFTPSPDSASLVDRLLAHQREEGSFGLRARPPWLPPRLKRPSSSDAPGGISELAQRCEISADRWRGRAPRRRPARW